VMKWMVPSYQKIVAVSNTTQSVIANNSESGFWYLLILSLSVLLIIIPLIVFKKRISSLE